MGTNQIIDQVESKYLKKKKPRFNIGDSVRVHLKVIEEKKERVQVFTGVVIAIKGKGLSETFTLHRVAYGCGMERLFLINSPRITKIEIMRSGKVKKAKLYYLKNKTGKKSKIKEQIGFKSNENDETEVEHQEEAVVEELEKLEEQAPSEEIVEENPKAEDKE